MIVAFLSTAPSSPLLASLVMGGAGAYVVILARKFYARPDEYIARWQRWLPQKPWSWGVVRGWALFCLWAGSLMIVTAATQLISVPHGVGPAFVASGIAVFCAYCLLPPNSKSLKSIGAIKRR